MRSYDAYGYSDDPYREGLIEANSPNDSSVRDTNAFSYRLAGNWSVNDNTYLTRANVGSLWSRFETGLTKRLNPFKS